MTDSIIRSQKDEVLNYDKELKLQTLNLAKKGVSPMNESADLNLTQSQSVIDGANMLINNLMLLLDNTVRSDSATAIQSWARYSAAL